MGNLLDVLPRDVPRRDGEHRVLVPLDEQLECVDVATRDELDDLGVAPDEGLLFHAHNVTRCHRTMSTRSWPSTELVAPGRTLVTAYRPSEARARPGSVTGPRLRPTIRWYPDFSPEGGIRT